MPFFTYCDVIYYPGLSAALREQLNRCFKASVRFVYNIKRRESTAAVRNSILGHDLETNYLNRISSFMHQGYAEVLPVYLQENLRKGPSTHIDREKECPDRWGTYLKPTSTNDQAAANTQLVQNCTHNKTKLISVIQLAISCLYSLILYRSKRKNSHRVYFLDLK